MPLTSNGSPLRWPGGPLEIARRQKAEGFTPAARQTLERWHQPAGLDFLGNAPPVDCLVVTWAAGLPEDALQQKTMAPLVEAARKRKLDVVGWVEGPANHGAALAAARSYGLRAVAIRDYKGKPDPLVLPWGGRAGAPWDSAGAVLPITENVWPGLQAGASAPNADAGPTALPWLDSNGWFVQLARARTKAPVWLTFDPPGKGRVLRAQDYSMAVCDSEVPGARWVVSLDDGLRAGLAEGNSSALDTWRSISAALTFFRKHRDWSSYRSMGRVGVVSDFAGENYDFSGEILNLMSRRDLLYRVIWKSQAAAAPFTGLKALAYADKAQPAPALRQKMLGFVQQGGLLVTGPNWGPQGQPVAVGFNTGFTVTTLGKGRLAVAKAELSDPWQFAVDTQYLLSHRNDLMKIFNSSSSGCTSLAASPDGKRAVLQGLSYAGGRSSLRTVWIQQPFRNARLWLIGGEPAPLQGQPSDEFTGMEYHLPANAAQPYFALEFEA